VDGLPNPENEGTKQLRNVWDYPGTDMASYHSRT